MKKKKTSTSGDVIRIHQRFHPAIGPRCQRAVIWCPASASTPIPSANDAQNPSATRSRCSRRRIVNPPVTMIASASAIHHDIGPHQKSSGSARPRPRIRKHATRPMFEGLNTCSPFHLTTCFESSDPPATAM
jgi:hypothetical protein